MGIQKRRKKNANNTRGGIVKAKRHTRDIDQVGVCSSSANFTLFLSDSRRLEGPGEVHQHAGR